MDPPPPPRRLIVPDYLVGLQPASSSGADGMAHIDSFLDGPTLTGETGTPAMLIAVLGKLRAADVIQSASKVLMKLESVQGHGIRAAQEPLVELFPPVMQQELRRAINADGESPRILFYPQQLVALERLAATFALPGAPTSFDNGREWPEFLKAAAWIGDISTALSGLDGTQDVDRETIAIWGIRNGEANRLAFYRRTAGRAHQMWFESDVPWPTGLQHVDDYCVAQYGLTYGEFVAMALAPAFARVDLGKPEPSDAVFVPSQYLATTRFSVGEINRVFESLTYQPVATDPNTGEPYWNFTPFSLTPYLAAPFPNLAVSSVRFAFERATTGTFWMLHQAHTGHVGDFTAHFGAIFEDYCLRLAKSVEHESCVVHDEFTYRDGGGNTVHTSDVMVTEGDGCAPASIFIECSALRPRGDLLAQGSRTAFEDYFERLIGKLGQLDRVINDFLLFAFELPNAFSTVNHAVIPILVVDLPFQWSFALRAMIDDRVREREWFRWPQVTAPVVCSISEFESLLHAVEVGDYISEVTRAYRASGQDQPLDQFLFERHGTLEVPAMVNGGFSQMTDHILSELQIREK